MQKLRTHNCGELNTNYIEQHVTLMGWLQSKRDFGGLIFLDIRDHFGITQVVVNPDCSFFKEVSDVRAESVVQISGKVTARQGAVNAKIATGKIEVVASSFYVESHCEILPFPIVNNPKQESEDSRLTYRYLDLRTEKMHHNILFRSNVIKFIRDKMFELGFNEFSTPILTSSSPEGARDFLVPSRLHAGSFYALPQAPQQFKQLLMCSGFAKYFQIAPCFRDEDPRADRAPGEFYQLDIEMSFVNQDDVFDMMEIVMTSIFENEHFSKNKILTLEHYKTEYQKSGRAFPCIPWKVAMDRYGSDKPDLRYGLEMQPVDECFTSTNFVLFKKTISEQGLIRAIVIPSAAAQSRKFFDTAEAYAKEIGLECLPWLAFKDGEWKGSVSKQLSESEKSLLQQKLDVKDNDAVIFIFGNQHLKTQVAGGKIRNYFADTLGLKKNSSWALAWIVDFPMYEFDEELGKFAFSHNPFSMPQGGLKALESLNPLDIIAYQYDLVCNGVELSSGAIRNHKRDIMKKVFSIAGYSEKDVETRFGALWNAFSFGPPPHGGIAPGIDRIVMLLLNEPNIREVIAFPLNQKALDLMMGAPSRISEEQLNEIHIQVKKLT